jgi:nucleoside 2-deoxyribosyltransferase
MSLLVFVLMPFTKKLNKRYKQAIKRAVQDAGLRAERVDKQSFHRQGVTDRIIQQIQDADFLIADMSGNNPNVLYEVGYAYAKNKLCIPLTTRPRKIPFDLKNKRHIVFRGVKDLYKQLLKDLNALKVEAELSFDATDPECLATAVPAAVFETRIIGQSQATSIRARVKTGSELDQKDVSARMTKIERRIGNRKWKQFQLDQPIQLTWVGDTVSMNFSGPATKYVNVFHIDHNENELKIWNVPISEGLSKFLKAKAVYRITVSVLERQIQLDIDWRRDWRTLKVQSR